MTELNHPDAALYTVERYVLDELSPPERDAFEEHCFECPDCAAELRASTAFLSAARRELRRGAGPVRRSMVKPRPARTPWFAVLWRPAVLAALAAALLVALVYQDAIVFPRARSEIARLSRPETLMTLSLIGANSRGGATASGTVGAGAPLLLSFDVPAAERFVSYSAELVDPGGTSLWSLPVTAEQAQDTVALRVPAGRWEPGDYTLLVLGRGPAEAAPTVLARYKFKMKRPD